MTLRYELSILRWGQTYGPAAGVETAEERKRREEEERLARDRAEKAKRERRCPECDKKVCHQHSLLFSCAATLYPTQFVWLSLL